MNPLVVFLHGLISGAFFTLANGTWEYFIGVRTRKHTTAEVSALKKRVDETVAEAKADRDRIMATIREVREGVAADVARVLDAIETGTRERIAAAREKMEQERATWAAELEARAGELEEARAKLETDYQERVGQLEARAQELERSAEMARRGALGRSSRDAKRERQEMTADELRILLAERYGARTVELVEEKYPVHFENACKWAGTPLGEKAMGLLVKHLEEGSTEENPSNPTPRKAAAWTPPF